ncbi:MAG: zinc-binding dehydrogenase [Deltaproteobacteria bacterium]|nr:zinc-binding dehydrogenase [Deltaproteobacteria bacterium]
MRAAYFNEHGGKEKIILGDLPVPKPRAGEVLIQVYYSAVNHLDLWVREGWPGLKKFFPHILGGDASGVVVESGEGAFQFKKGDPVIVHPGVSCGHCQNCLGGWESLCSQYAILGEQICGTHAEFICVPQENLFLKPERVSFVEAAAIPLVFTTAWQMLIKRAHLKSGDKVLIHGAGSGVSSAAIQIAKLFGAIVAVTSTHEDKLLKAKTLGADFLINSSREDFSKTVKQYWQTGPDIILDHVGEAFWEKNIKCLRTGGTLVTCGATGGGKGTTDLKHLFFRQLSLLGSTMGNKSDFSEILKRVDLGRLKAVVDREFGLDEVAKAHDYLESQKQFGKVMIKVLP